MQPNPEFRRYLWLEISPQRLISMPAILGATFYLIALAGGDVGFLAEWSLTIYLLLVLLWGTRSAASAVVSEVRGGTWDWQRMSAVRPWQMVWGKLFGATIFPWFGAVICLGVFIFVLLLRTGQGAMLPAMVFLLLASAILAHAVSLAASLLWLHRRGAEKRSVLVLPQLLGLAAGGYAYIQASRTAGLGAEAFSTRVWHGMTFDLEGFVLVSLAVFLAWALLGVYRLMRAELQVRQQPWAWAAFVVFLVIYVSGLPAPRAAQAGMIDLLTARLMLAFGLALALAYVTYFLFEKDPISLRGLILALKGGDGRRALRLLPQWLIATVITALVALAYVVCLLLLDDRQGPGETLLGMDFRQAGILMTLGLLGFLLRDLAIILFLNLRGGRPDAAALVYLLVLHLLVPALMVALGLGGLVGLVSPFAHIGSLPLQVFSLGATPDQLPGFLSGDLARVPWLIALGALPQVALLAVLLAGRWRRFQSDIDRSLAHEAV